jgi:hypothetical protein
VDVLNGGNGNDWLLGDDLNIGAGGDDNSLFDELILRPETVGAHGMRP